MKILTTFSGCNGDILWALPTVREIMLRSQIEADRGCTLKVDLGIMSDFKSLLPLLEAQPYIGKAFDIKEWICTGNTHGCQPWQSPDFEGREKYDKVIDLTYKYHPRPTPLAQFIANQAGVQLDGQPFIETNQDDCVEVKPYIAYAFNPEYANEKAHLLESLKILTQSQNPNIAFINVAEFPWLKAAALIKNAIAFVGCRSANYVLAHGVSQRVISFEPNPWRREVTYSYPYGIEKMCSNHYEAFTQLQNWMKEVEVIKCA